jgi:hypothetical protein
MRWLRIAPVLVSAFFALSAGPVRSEQQPEANAAFAKLSGLVGTWKRAETSGSQLSIDFELTANNTVLVERWMHAGTMHSLTVYHLDGEALMATHYCPQGNQPRLKMAAGTVADRIVFEFHDATNLQHIDESHQHRLSFDLADMKRVIRGEVYRQGKSKSETEMTLVRIP